MRILIAVNQSNSSESALEKIAEGTWPRETVFRLVSVIDSRTIRAQQAASQIKRQAQIFINEKIIELGLAVGSGQVEGIVRNGAIIEEIIDEAKRWPPDLIVVGYQVDADSDHLRLESVAYKLASRCDYSIEILKSNARAGSKVEAKTTVPEMTRKMQKGSISL